MGLFRIKSTLFRTAASAAVIGVLAGLPVLAQNVDVGLDAAAATGLSTTDIRTFIGRIVSYFLGLLGIIAVALVMYAGFLWMTAGGNEEKIAQAKRILTNAVIGLVIIVSAFAIVQFVLNAIVNGSGGGGGGGATSGGCRSGQNCGFGIGGSASFHVTGVMPAGPGPNNGGWPKNYAITAFLSASVYKDSVTDATVEVRKCNPRLDGSGAFQSFDERSCGAPIEGTHSVDGNRIVFRPKSDPTDNTTDFTADFWYMLRLRGGDIKDLQSRPLFCPFTPAGEAGDISSPNADSGLCDRAVAFNDQRDVSAPTVSISAPSFPPAFCSGLPVTVSATATDDFLAAAIDFLLDGGTANLVDSGGIAKANDVNVSFASPFISSAIKVDMLGLAEGMHTVSAIAQDGNPLASAPASSQFKVNAAHCCNGIMDEGETGKDCGGNCGVCVGSVCSNDADCASGFCDSVSGTCAEKPVIESVSPVKAGPGSHVTISGRFFGSQAGKVAFLGGPDASDDLVVDACASAAWSGSQIVVVVPTGAVNGPIEVRSANGQTDRTDDSWGGVMPDFDTSGALLPGICTLTPATAAPGSKFTVTGAGFGDTIGTGKLRVGEYDADIDLGGWSAAALTGIVPTAPERLYNATVTVGGKVSNGVALNVSYGSGAAGMPRVTGVIPEHAPPGSYVTIVGTGFGSARGTVKFLNGQDEALGQETVCADDWHDKYIIVKVPSLYADNSAVEFSGNDGTPHNIKVMTAAPAKTSNEDVILGFTNEDVTPGLCQISPDNGPPTAMIEVKGTGFGSRSVAANAARSSVDFFKAGANDLQAVSYGFWQPSIISVQVPGVFTDKSTWPESGPVGVTALNIQSSNRIPFKVGDCHDAANACAAPEICCGNGSCKAPTVPGRNPCEPVPRISAYGWMFSTEVLPDYPIVVEHAMCSSTSNPPTLQSPSPFKDSQDACINAALRVEFSERMDLSPDLLDGAVQMKVCGNGVEPVCETAAVSQMTYLRTGCDGTSFDCSVLQFGPDDPGSSDIGDLEPNTWYEIRLVSDPDNGVGLQQGGAMSGRWLDGDFNGRPGGDYVYSFKTKATGGDCDVFAAYVDPTHETINQDEEPVSFLGVPVAENCNVLQCSETIAAAFQWSADPAYLSLMAAPSEAAKRCYKPVMAKKETTLTTLNLTVPGLPQPSGHSDIQIKFQDPRVIAVTPTADCTDACINAQIKATFNVFMNKESLTAVGNVVLYECRNSTCAEPLIGTGSLRHAEAADIVVSNGKDVSKDVILTGGNMKPDTYYLVKVKGGPDGVISRSGALLAGLNDAPFYTWKFKTKADPAPCKASSTNVTPAVAKLYYIGQRLPLTAHAFGSSACSANGQELVTDYMDWSWTLAAPNAVIGGFVFNDENKIGLDPVRTFAVSGPDPAPGCTADCRLRGSQNVIPQCGNGSLDSKFEECDTPGQSGCNSSCLKAGAKAVSDGGTCGDGIVNANAGENCDAIAQTAAPGQPVTYVFPPGCKKPEDAPAGLGCSLTGSATAVGAICGDRLIGDGEACDDGNKQSGDGCSSVCLKEGTLASCGAADGAQTTGPCVNFCGNGKWEKGEDPLCDGPNVNPSLAGCDTRICLKADLAQRNQGSSTLYSPVPSVCGDGIPGPGEDAICEHAPDAKVDPRQTMQAAAVKGVFDSTKTNSSKVRAAADDVPEEKASPANVTLSCTCQKQPLDEQDAFCQQFAPGGVNLGCAANGCCATRPTVQLKIPDRATGVCRNTLIKLEFDQVMDPASVRDSIQVGYAKGSGTCPEGSEIIRVNIQASAGSAIERLGWFGRVISAITDFLDRYVFQSVWAVGETDYCSVPTTVTTTNVGLDSNKSVARVYLTSSLPAIKETLVKVLPGVKSIDGVPMQPIKINDQPSEGYRESFVTSDIICQLEKVMVTPRSSLISSVDQEDVELAITGVSTNGQEIVPTAEYGWTWSWRPQSSTDPVSPIVLEPRACGNNICEKGELITSCPADCKTQSQVDSAPVGVNIPTAYARVRGASITDVPAGYKPTNGQAVVQGGALLANDNFLKGQSNVTVMLCENPWPRTVSCDSSGHFSFLWDPSPALNECTPGTKLWYPFYDKVNDFSTYYCRDTQKAGDTGRLLPALKETPVAVTPGRDIIKEYLFTYDTVVQTPAFGEEWGSDALGFRLAKNLDHVGPRQWYSRKGFTGGPSPKVVDGFEGLVEGRTIYVNAIQNVKGPSTGALYTNIGVLSYTDGAAPETVQVYQQIVDNLNFLNVNGLSMDEGGSCVDDSDRPAMCSTDADCRVDFAGVEDPERKDFVCNVARAVCQHKQGETWFDDAGGRLQTCDADVDCRAGRSYDYYPDKDGLPQRLDFSCDATKPKLIRDAKRWADLQEMRSGLVRSQIEGKLPRLNAGSYLVTITNSTWSSWNSALSAGAGFVLPKDPVNSHEWCRDEGRDPETCWKQSEQKYVCPAGSHVYGYAFRQESSGPDFTISSDFETNLTDFNSDWAGNTCPERSVSTCVTTDGLCEIQGSGSSAFCDYKLGRMTIGGVNVGAACSNVYDTSTGVQAWDSQIGSGGVCGDGIVSPGAGEVCEPGAVNSRTCGTGGFVTQVCEDTGPNRCKAWKDKQGAVCQQGFCGDGVINGGEFCDDGTLNGTYGHCAVGCGGEGFRCGDGQRQPGERCDCGSTNGVYAFDGIVAPSGSYSSSSGGTSTCGGSGASKASCAWDCSGAGPRCGDGIVNGTTEVCDGGSQTSKGYCSTAGTVNSNPATGTLSPCETDADCPKYNNNAQKCGHYCPTAEQTNRRLCGSNQSSTTNDNATACKWATWQCTAPGYCGNGKKDTGEECDDGNTNNDDGCIIDPATNRMCKLATCGDGYVNAGAGEQCDEGKNNDAACTAQYGRTCTYCSSFCKTVTRQGGYCGDGVIQGATTNPRGPEECDGTQGLYSFTEEYVCFSTRPEAQAFGVRTGPAICNPNSCIRSCAKPDSNVCTQLKSESNIDSNTPNGWHNLSASPNPVIDSLGLFVIVGPTWAADWLKNGGPQPDGTTEGLRNSCDPDKDNDGVPAGPADCVDTDKTIHGEYNLQYSFGDGSSGVKWPYHVAASPEVCDGKDNDCDSQYDEYYHVTGKIIDLQTGEGLSGAVVDLYCDDTLIMTTGVYNSAGDFGAWGEYDRSKCVNASKWRVHPRYSAELCANDLYFTYSQYQCMQADNLQFAVTKRPPAGTFRASIAWDADKDYDLLLFADDGKYLNYLNLNVNDGGYIYNLDVDDRGGTKLAPRGPYNPGGIETITAARKPGVTYTLAVEDYDVSKTPNMYDSNLKLRLFYDNCSQFNWAPVPGGQPMTYPSSGWTGHPGNGKRYLSYIQVPKVEYPENDNNNGACTGRYEFCCGPTDPSSPAGTGPQVNVCTAYCSSLTAATGGLNYACKN